MHVDFGKARHRAIAAGEVYFWDGEAHRCVLCFEKTHGIVDKKPIHRSEIHLNGCIFGAHSAYSAIELLV